MPSNNTKPCFLQPNFGGFDKKLIRSQTDGLTGETDTLFEFSSTTETSSHLNKSPSAQMNAVSFQSSTGLSNVVHKGQSRAGALQYMALQLPTGCFNLVNRTRVERQQPRKATGLSLFKSITSTDTKPKKRTYAEINQSQSSFRPISTQISENTNAKRQRFLRTAEALEKSGLMKVTMDSASLLQKNKNLQKEIEELKTETQKFIQWVMSNPENQHLRSTC